MRKYAIPVLALAAVAAMMFVPPIHQSASYHNFADRRTILGVPNFWNVISNAAFLAAAAAGLGALRRRESFVSAWERRSAALFIAAIAAVALGSGYYHWNPTDATLFWDRLPMTVGFMALYADVLGQSVLVLPLLAVGVGSVAWWQATGDLRWYALVQFFPALTIPLALWLYGPRYRGAAGAFTGLFAGYFAAKLCESFDGAIGSVLATGGHPWKHVFAAAGVWWYLRWMALRTPRADESTPRAASPAPSR